MMLVAFMETADTNGGHQESAWHTVGQDGKRLEIRCKEWRARLAAAVVRKRRWRSLPLYQRHNQRKKVCTKRIYRRSSRVRARPQVVCREEKHHKIPGGSWKLFKTPAHNTMSSVRWSQSQEERAPRGGNETTRGEALERGEETQWTNRNLEKTSPPANKQQLQAEKLKSDVLKTRAWGCQGFQLLETVSKDLELVQRLKAEKDISRKVRRGWNTPRDQPVPRETSRRAQEGPVGEDVWGKQWQ